MPTKIVLAEDHPIVCEGISMVTEGLGMEVVHVVDASEKMASAVAEHRPQLLITEVRLGGHDALKVLEHVNAEMPECKVVVFTRFNNPTNIARSSALGCHEFIPKSACSEVLAEALRSAAAGEATSDNSLLMTTKTRMKRTTKFSNDSPLTNRETQVLRHVSMGLKNREIGKSLGISVETVKEHVQNILRKLNVNDRTQAAVWAIRNDFI